MDMLRFGFLKSDGACIYFTFRYIDKVMSLNNLHYNEWSYVSCLDGKHCLDLEHVQDLLFILIS